MSSARTLGLALITAAWAATGVPSNPAAGAGCRDGGGSTRLLHGLEPEVIDGYTLQLHAGHFADSTGCHVIDVRRPLRINLKAVGLGGMDEAAPRPGRHYFIYLVTTRTGQTGAVVSSRIAVSEFNSGGRFATVRKLPWGFVFTEGGVPAVHLSYWPKPFTRYTEAASTPEWAVLQGGAESEWTRVNVARLVPDNARMAYLMIEVRHLGGPGSAAGFVRVLGSQGDGLMVGRVSGGNSSVLTLHQRITSTGDFFYRVEPGAVMYVHILGYSNTEPS